MGQVSVGLLCALEASFYNFWFRLWTILWIQLFWLFYMRRNYNLCFSYWLVEDFTNVCAPVSNQIHFIWSLVGQVRPQRLKQQSGIEWMSSTLTRSRCHWSMFLLKPLKGQHGCSRLLSCVLSWSGHLSCRSPHYITLHFWGLLLVHIKTHVCTCIHAYMRLQVNSSGLRTFSWLWAPISLPEWWVSWIRYWPNSWWRAAELRTLLSFRDRLHHWGNPLTALP